MESHGFADSDVGLVRKNNEDFYICDDELGLYLVCDGVGGHAAGEVASNLAATSVRDFLRETLQTIDTDNVQKTAQLVTKAIQKACYEIYSLSKRNKEYAGMATTITLLLIRGDKGYMGHVGDSRLYIQRNSELHQLSNDHTIINELYQQGLVPEDALEKSPIANVLNRSLGHEATVQVDNLIFNILPDDRFLLCSDGLTRNISKKTELYNEIANLDIQSLPERLIKISNKRGGNDNTTAVAVYISGDKTEELIIEYTENIQLQLSVLKEIELFKGLTYRELIKVMEKTTLKIFQKDEILLNEGSFGDSLYIILNGEVSIVKGDIYLTTLKKNDHFGEIALLKKQPRTASAVAESNGKALIIKHDVFQETLNKNSEIGVKLLRNLANELCKKLIKTNQYLSNLGM